MRQSEKEGDPEGKELLQTMASRVNRLNGIRNEFCLCFGYFSPGSQLLMYSPSEVKDYLEWFIILCVRFFYSIPRKIPRSDEKWAVCPDFIVYKVPASLSSHLQSALKQVNAIFCRHWHQSKYSKQNIISSHVLKYWWDNRKYALYYPLIWSNQKLYSKKWIDDSHSIIFS